MNAPGTMPELPPRFVPVPDDAILDRHTGLVWEASPTPGPVSWDTAARSASGPRWRLPTASELMLLLCGLRDDHPFPPPAAGTVFWSATESPFSAHGQVRAIGCQADSLYVVRLIDKRATAHVWRVREGS